MPDAETTWSILIDAPVLPYLWNDITAWDDAGFWAEDIQWSDLATGDPTDEV